MVLLVVSIVLYVLAALCFAVALIVRRSENVPWNGWVPLGLLFWVLVPLIQTVASIP